MIYLKIKDFNIIDGKTGKRYEVHSGYLHLVDGVGRDYACVLTGDGGVSTEVVEEEQVGKEEERGPIIKLIVDPNKTEFMINESFKVKYEYEPNPQKPPNLKMFVIKKGNTIIKTFNLGYNKFETLSVKNKKFTGNCYITDYGLETVKKEIKVYSQLTISIYNDVKSITDLGSTLKKRLNSKFVKLKVLENKDDKIDVFVFCYNSQYLPHEDIKNSLDELKEKSTTKSVILLQVVDDMHLDGFLESESKNLYELVKDYPSGIFLNKSTPTKREDNLFMPVKNNKIHTSPGVKEEVDDQLGHLVNYLKIVADKKD